MKTIILMILALVFLSDYSNAQLFKNGTKVYKTIVNNWDISDYKAFLKAYPSSKYKKDITQRLTCKERNDAFYAVSTSMDTNQLKTYISTYDTCTFCKGYLPTYSLIHLSQTDRDLGVVSDSLENKRAYYFWELNILKGGATDYKIVASFVQKYPKSYFIPMALDTLHARKDLSFWNNALQKDNSNGYKLYCDSIPSGSHIGEALSLYYEYQLGEAMLAITSHKELTEGLAKLKSIQPQSKFISIIMARLQSIEQKEYSKCLKEKSLTSWINFEKSYPNGYYFKEVDKKIRALAKIEKSENRSPFGTFVELTNENTYPIKFEFSNDNGNTEIIRVDAAQTSGIILTSGRKKIRVTNVKTGEKMYDLNDIFTGIPLNLTP